MIKDRITPHNGRYHVIHVDIYQDGRFVCTNHLKARMVYSFRFGRWVVEDDEIQRLLQERYPSMIESGKYEFFIN